MRARLAAEPRTGDPDPYDQSMSVASSAVTFDVRAEMGVSATFGERVERDLHRRVGRTTRFAERHRDVERVDDDVIERTLYAADGWLPAVQDFVAEVPEKLDRRQLGVAARHLVGDSGEVELAVAEFGHERFFVVASRHGHVRDDLADAPAFTERRHLPAIGRQRLEPVGERHEVGGHERLEFFVGHGFCCSFGSARIFG